MFFNLFKSKQRVSLATFCGNYYNDELIGKSDLCIVDFYWRKVRDMAILEDENFSVVDIDVFKREMISLSFEIFSTAWMHKFGCKQSVLQTIFTYDFLKDKGLTDFWTIMREYNTVVARSTNFVGGNDSKLVEGIAQISNSARIKLFKEYTEKGFDKDCVACAVNRFYSQKVWDNTTTAGLLTLKVCERLNVELNEEAMLRLTASMLQVYENIDEALSKIKL